MRVLRQQRNRIGLKPLFLIWAMATIVLIAGKNAKAQDAGGPNDVPSPGWPTDNYYTGYGGIYADNKFPSDKRAVIGNTLNLMTRVNSTFITSPSGPSITPFTHLNNNIFMIYYVPVYANTWAYTNMQYDINLHDNSPWHSASLMASVFLHEADHKRYGAHTCGSGDINIDGPTGVGILYGAKQYYSGQLSANDKSLIYSDSNSRIYSFLCNHAPSMDIATKALNNNIWPVRPPPPPPKETCGAVGKLNVKCL